MKISVVIPTYNRRELLACTLSTVLSQDFQPSEYEVIVVIDGSRDGSVEFLQQLRPACALRVVEQHNAGQAAAKNAGISLARGDLVLFLDDDILCAPSLLSEHARAHYDHRSEVIFGPVFVAAESRNSLATDWTRAFSDHYYGSLAAGDAPRSLDGMHVLPNSSLPRRAIVDCGGFDASFFRAHEDSELARRLWEKGLRFRYLPSAIAHQIFVKSFKDIIREDAKWDGRAEVLLCRKHPGYRVDSEFASFNRGTALARIARRLAVRAPIPPEALLIPSIWGAERLRRFETVRKAGMLALSFARRIAILRSALREVASWRAFEREFGIRVVALMYHHVGPRRPGTLPSLTVTPDRFERHIRRLASIGYVGMRPVDWLKWCRSGRSLPAKPVLITFDDAYGDTAEFALPILRRYGFSGAVYVVTSQIGGTNAWDQSRASNIHPLMTADQIRYWSHQEIEIGAHSRSHANLTALSGADIESETSGSAADLIEILGTRPTSFVYPYGCYNAAVVRCVRKSFDLGITCDEGVNSLDTDLHLLKRVSVSQSDTPVDVQLKAQMGWSPFLSLRSQLRMRTRWSKLLTRVNGRTPAATMKSDPR